MFINQVIEKQFNDEVIFQEEEDEISFIAMHKKLILPTYIDVGISLQVQIFKAHKHSHFSFLFFFNGTQGVASLLAKITISFYPLLLLLENERVSISIGCCLSDFLCQHVLFVILEKGKIIIIFLISQKIINHSQLYGEKHLIHAEPHLAADHCMSIIRSQPTLK